MSIVYELLIYYDKDILWIMDDGNITYFNKNVLIKLIF